MDSSVFDLHDIDIQWCPGCGDFGIMKSLKEALADLDISPEQVVIVTGIGQAAKIAQFMKANFFNGLHGRTLSYATAIKVSNPSLHVVAVSGDGDLYGEGGNHFIHTIRRNPDITVIACDNMIYGLTKGQASPTSPLGLKTTLQFDGVVNEPFNPLSVSIAQKIGFVARAFAGDTDKTREIIKRAILHKGFSLVDIFQPCVSFNKVNTYDWFRNNTFYLDEEYKSNDRNQAFDLAMKDAPYPLGVIYEEKSRPTFEDNIGVFRNDSRPLFRRELDVRKLEELLELKK